MAEFGSSGAKYNTIFRKIRGLCLIIWHDKMLKKSLTCPNGFGLKLAKLGLIIPLKKVQSSLSYRDIRGNRKTALSEIRATRVIE